MKKHTLKICTPKGEPDQVVVPHSVKFMVGDKELSGVTSVQFVIENDCVVSAKIELAVLLGEYDHADNQG